MVAPDGTYLGTSSGIAMPCGFRCQFRKTRGTGEEACYNVSYEYKQRDVGLAAGELAMKLIMHLLLESAISNRI